MQFASLYPILHRGLSWAFPDCLWSGSSDERAVALTFDDGPHPQFTMPLIEVLSRYNVTASFFWLGSRIDHAPAIAKQVFDQGHWLGLHGYTHRAFPRLGPAAVKASLERTQQAIAQACRLELSQVEAYIRDVRPPNGLFTPTLLRKLQQWGYRPVMWSLVPEDWTQPGVASVVRRVMGQVRSGSLVVLHDGDYGGQDVADIVAILIPELVQQGYQFVTVDQLWQQKSCEDGGS